MDGCSRVQWETNKTRGCNAHLRGQRFPGNLGKHPPLLVSGVAEPAASRTLPTSPLCISENVLLRAPKDVTCPRVYTPLNRSPPHHGCVFVLSLPLVLLFKRKKSNKKKKGHKESLPSRHLLGVVLQTGPEMFRLI